MRTTFKLMESHLKLELKSIKTCITDEMYVHMYSRKNFPYIVLHYIIRSTVAKVDKNIVLPKFSLEFPISLVHNIVCYALINKDQFELNC